MYPGNPYRRKKMGKTTIEKKGEHVIVTLNDDLNYFNIRNIMDEMTGLADQVEKSMIIDLAGVYFVDSAVLGFFAMLCSRLRARDREFGLVNVDERMMDLLKLSTLDENIRIYNSIDDII
jgi:anti-anti-sigma factor